MTDKMAMEEMEGGRYVRNWDAIPRESKVVDQKDMEPIQRDKPQLPSTSSSRP